MDDPPVASSNETCSESLFDVLQGLEGTKFQRQALLHAFGAASARLYLEQQRRGSSFFRSVDESRTNSLYMWNCRADPLKSPRIAADPSNLAIATIEGSWRSIVLVNVAYVIADAIALLAKQSDPESTLAVAAAVLSGFSAVHQLPNAELEVLAARVISALHCAGVPDSTSALAQSLQGVLEQASGRCRLPPIEMGPLASEHPPVLHPRALSTAQKATSEAVVTALRALPDDALAAVMVTRHSVLDPSTAGSPSLWASVNSPPHVFDFTARNASLRSLTGHGNPARLDAFTAATFSPLLFPLSSGAPEGSLLSSAVDPVAAAWEGPPLDRIARLGWGRYGEDRVLYDSEHFIPADAPAGAAPARTVHLGVDLFAPAGTPVFAPLAGLVHSVAVNTAPLDYGPTVVLRHELQDPCAADRRLEFFSLYGHLSLASLVNADGSRRLRPGDTVPAGAAVGWVGPRTINGGWPPHVHFQICTEAAMGGWQGDYPGVCTKEDWGAFKVLCPDPNLLLRFTSAHESLLEPS